MTPMVHGDVSPGESPRKKSAKSAGFRARSNHGSRAELRLRTAASLVTWMVAAAVAQVAVGEELADASRQMEERLEMQILGSPGAAPSPVQPERTREESIEPWELVEV
jgi:hypothetical protein